MLNNENSAEAVREYYRKQGEERERARIIKLFEQQDLAAWFGLNKAAVELINGNLPEKQEFADEEPQPDPEPQCECAVCFHNPKTRCQICIEAESDCQIPEPCS